MGIATLGTLSYGSVVFTALERSSISSVPRWDDAGRDVISVRHHLEVEGWVGASPSTDSTMAQLNTVLSTPGLKLLYTDRGFGGSDGTGLHVNDGTVFDCAYGPKPELIRYTPLGGGQAARVVWQVTTEIPMCSGATYKGRPMAFNFSWGVSIGQDGLSRIRYRGYIEIPATRIPPSRNVPDCADAYRNLLAQCKPPQGFRRSQDYDVTPDKRRLDFSWTDEQMQYPLPTGAVYAEARHTVRWSHQNIGWLTCNLSGSITMAPDQPPEKALEKWQTIVASRVTSVEKTNALAGVGAGPLGFAAAAAGAAIAAAGAPKVKPNIFLTDTEVTEELFSRTSHFSTTYRIIGAKLADLLSSTALYTKIGDFDAWAKSMENTASNIRGAAKLQLDASTDGIVDLCSGGNITGRKASPPKKPKAQQNAPKIGVGKGETVVADIQGKAVAPPIEQNQGVPANVVGPEGSWIMYESWYALTEDDRIVTHKPLTGADGVAKAKEILGGAGADWNAVAKKVGGSKPLVDANVPDKIQRVSAPTYRLWMWGRAVRLGHRIPNFEGPGEILLGQDPPEPQGGEQNESCIGAIGGVPIYARTWKYLYSLPSKPARMPINANPSLQIPAS